MIKDSLYLNWHQKLSISPGFRAFWKFAGLYSIIFYAGLALWALNFDRGWKVVLAAAAAALFTRYVVCELIILFYKKPHPYQRLGFRPPTSRLFSFADNRPDALPSQHASAATAISIIFFLFAPILGWWAFVVAILTSAGRIVLGYHDIADVLAGWIAGIIFGYVIYALSLYLMLRF